MALQKSQKSLKKWSDSDWDYVTKGDEKKPKSQRGRYLPKSVRESLTPGQKAATNRKKKAATAQGKQNAKYSKDLAKKVTKASKVMKEGGKTPAWQRKEGKNPSGGLNKKGVASYRKDNPGSKLKTAVTTKPSKLKPGSKDSKRRISFCARMEGMKKKLTSTKTANDPNSRINKSLRKWNCKDGGRIPRKPGQPANSKQHSDLYTDENPKGTIHGLKFDTVANAKKSVNKIKNSGKTHAHKIQAAIAMEQRARVMGKSSQAGVYRAFINSSKKKQDGGAVRDYKDEYKKFQSSPTQIKKRTELNRINYKKGTYGNGDKMDVSHLKGKIKLEPQSKNRGRKEKSRMNGSPRKMTNGGEISKKKSIEGISFKRKTKKKGSGFETTSILKVKTPKGIRYYEAKAKSKDRGMAMKKADLKAKIKAVDFPQDSLKIKKMGKGGSTVNKAGNYTKPGMRKRLFNKIMAGSKGGNPGQWSARKAQMLAKQYKAAGGGYKAAEGGSVEDLKKIVKELQGASKMHLGQSKRVAKHVGMMSKKMAKGGSLKPVDATKNPGLAKLPKEVRNKMGYMQKGGLTKLNPGDSVKKSKKTNLENLKESIKKLGKGLKSLPKDLSKAAQSNKKKTKKTVVKGVKTPAKVTTKDMFKIDSNKALQAREKKIRQLAKTINPNSKKSVMAFQKAAGLQVDGKLGPATLRKLRAVQGKKVAKKVTAKKKSLPKSPFTDMKFRKNEKSKGKQKKSLTEKEAKIAKKAQERFKKRKLEELKSKAKKRAKKGLKTFDPETGKKIMQKGGMLKGPSHAKGGIAAKVGNQPIEMEGGEYIIKKSSAKKLGEDVLNYLNETGKVPQFMAGGYTKKMYMDGGMTEEKAMEMGGMINDTRSSLTPIYKHGGCVNMTTPASGVGDVTNVSTHSGYKVGE